MKELPIASRFEFELHQQKRLSEKYHDALIAAATTVAMTGRGQRKSVALPTSTVPSVEPDLATVCTTNAVIRELDRVSSPFSRRLGSAIELTSVGPEISATMSRVLPAVSLSHAGSRSKVACRPVNRTRLSLGRINSNSVS